KETQNRIYALLHLDYDTFVNSAFLQQGRADSFTAKTPAQRKMLLADILGLDRWQTYEERVKEKLVAITESMRNIDVMIGDKVQTEAEEPALRGELTRTLKQSQEARQELETAELRYNEVAGAPDQLKEKQKHLETVKRQHEQRHNDLT